jgi:hypothetical protein
VPVLLSRRRKPAPPEPSADVAAAADRVLDTVERLLDEYRLPTNGAVKRPSPRINRLVLARVCHSRHAPYPQIRQAILHGTLAFVGTLVVAIIVVYAS